jgi:hypothetical protein
MQISGTEVTPEPSSWVLFGAGVLGLVGSARRKFLLRWLNHGQAPQASRA